MRDKYCANRINQKTSYVVKINPKTDINIKMMLMRKSN